MPNFIFLRYFGLFFVLCVAFPLSKAQELSESLFNEAPPDEDIKNEDMLVPSDLMMYEKGMDMCKRSKRGLTSYAGVEGMLTDGDCTALYFFARLQIQNAKKRDRNIFLYIETGSFQGLSAHLVTTAILDATYPGLVYSHDLFDEALPSDSSSDAEIFWDSTVDGITRLQAFYNNIQRNRLIQLVLPIAGPSHRTLRIHQEASIDLAFVDGDHSYQGALGDMRLAWKALIPGGVMLVHDCFPHSDELGVVRQAVKDFSAEINVSWTFFRRSMYMAVMFKPDTTDTQSK